MKLIKIEKYVFLFIVLLNAIPIFFFDFFPTLDGPAHIYNVNLIKILFTENNKIIQDYFLLNNEIVPNWTGHILLLILNVFLKPNLAEQFLVFLYLIGISYSFRALVMTINKRNYLFSYFIFPFTYTAVLLFGFYNFSISIVFLLLSINYWLKHEENIYKYKHFFALTFFILLTYFSHVFVFLILGLILGIQILTYKSTIKVGFKLNFQKIIKKGIFLIISSIIPISFFLYYFFLRNKNTNYEFLSKKKLLQSLIDISSIIPPNFYNRFTKLLIIPIALLLLLSIYNFIKNKKNPFIEKFSKFSNFLAFGTISVLILYFVMPDSDGLAGFVSIRIEYLFYIFLMLFFATQSFHKYVIYIAVIIMLFCSIGINIHNFETNKQLNKIALATIETGKFIPKNTIVLPLNFSEKWITGHFSNYLGMEKPLVILDNYESGTGYFPLLWNRDSLYNSKLGSINSNQLPCVWWETNETNKKVIIDYIFIMKNTKNEYETCQKEILTEIEKSYKIIFENEFCQLGKKNDDEH